MNDNFETIIDSDGKEHRILKDKGRTRVPVMLRDAAGFCMNCPCRSVSAVQPGTKLAEAELGRGSVTNSWPD